MSLFNLFNKNSTENAGKLIHYTNTPKKDKNVLKRKITWLLTQFEHLRDDDIELINTIWRDEVGGMYESPEYLPFEMFYTFHQHLTRADTICRYRRRIQQLQPELRGKFYKERNAKQDEAKKELGYKNEPTP